jgi:hypothetical protein
VRARALILGAFLSATSAVAGCQQAPQASRAAVVVTDPLVAAVEAMDRHDYTRAASLLRGLLVAKPDHLQAHYHLAVSASYLDLTPEARQEFEWVVSHGPAESSEVKMARQWLAQMGSTSPPPTPTTSAEANPDSATLVGTVTSDEGGPTAPRPFKRLFLKGLKGTPVQDEFHRFQTDQQGAFRLTGLRPGEYRLADGVAGKLSWRLPVILKAGETLTLDLSPANQLKAPEDVAESG